MSEINRFKNALISGRFCREDSNVAPSQNSSHRGAAGERGGGQDDAGVGGGILNYLFYAHVLAMPTLASGSLDRTVRVWETESGRLAGGHTRRSVRALASLPGELVTSESGDRTVVVWHVANAVGQ